MNIDWPASELVQKVDGGSVSSVLARAENVEMRGGWSQGRKGTARYSYTKLPGSGEIYDLKQHRSIKKWLLHRGTSLWVADVNQQFWTELTAKSAAIQGSDSTIREFDDDFMVFNKSGIFYVYLTNNEYFKFNSDCPFNRGIDADSSYVVFFTASASTDLLTLNSSKYLPTGMRVFLEETTGTLPEPLVENTTYYVIHQSKTTIKLAETLDAAQGGDPINLTTNGSANTKLTGYLDYHYRYVFTFLRMVKSDGSSAAGMDRRHPDTEILSETGCKRNYGVNTRDFGVYKTPHKINTDNPLTVDLTFEETDIDGSAVSIADNTIPVGEEYDTGMRVQLGTDAELPTPFQTSTDYYVINVNSTTIKLASTLKDALEGTAIDILGTGSGLIYLYPYISYGKDDAHTHIGIYRTLNISGQGNQYPSPVPDAYDPETNAGNNIELYGWVADVDIGDSDYTDNITDEQLRPEMATGRYLAKMRGFVPLPSGEVGYVHPGWLFTAERGKNRLYYSSLSEIQKIYGGHYSPLQFHKWDQAIQQLALIEDTLIVCLSNSTKPVIVTSWDSKGLLEFVPVINHFPDGDKTTGVGDWGTVTEVENSTIMAVCSDQTVRIWNGSTWGEDLSYNWVNSEIRKMVKGSVGVYYKKAFYLWYRTDSSVAYNNKCLKLSLKETAGEGWVFYNGSKWVFPPLRVGANIIQDENDVQKLVVLDHEDHYPYWLETFDSANDSESFADKKIDGGFCALGSKFFYDELDGNTLDANLTAET